MWNTIGTIREAMCDYDGAGSAYRRAAAILDRHNDDDTVVPARITVTSSSARLHRTLGRLDAAERLYLAAITAAEKHFGTGAVEVATLLNDLAVVYKYAARFDDAEALYRRALGIIEAARAPTTSMRRRSGTTWGASSTPGAVSLTARSTPADQCKSAKRCSAPITRSWALS